MRICISALPRAGLKIADEHPVASINERVNLGRGNDVTFVAPPSFNVMISESGSKGVYGRSFTITGTISSRYQQPCSLCWDPKLHSVTAEVGCIAVQGSPPAETRRESLEMVELQDQPELVFFQGEYLDLAPILEEALILKLSRHWHPELTKDGSCVACGKSAEDRSNLLNINLNPSAEKRSEATEQKSTAGPCVTGSLGALIQRALKDGQN